MQLRNWILYAYSDRCSNHFQLFSFIHRRARTSCPLAEKRSHHGLDKHQTVCILNFKCPNRVPIHVWRTATAYGTIWSSLTFNFHIFTIFTLLLACVQASGNSAASCISTGSCTICNYSQLQQAHNLPTGLWARFGMLHLIAYSIAYKCMYLTRRIVRNPTRLLLKV